jgi:drug/metabolite transporter (DMT)-like permease
MAVLTVTWGCNWSVMKIGATAMPPLWFRGISLALGTALLAGVLVARGVSLRLRPGDFGRVVVVAIPNIVIWYAVVTVAVTMLPVARAAILGYTMPAWAALIGALVYRERLEPAMRVGVACAIAGIVLLVGGDLDTIAAHPVGTSLMLVAAIAWAWGTHLLRRSTLQMDTLALTFWMMLIACPLIFAMSWLHGEPWTLPTGAPWGPILYNAVVVLALGNVLWFQVARALPPVASGLSSMLIPVIGVFSGIAMLGEHPGWRDWVALALIAIAVVAGLVPKRTPAGVTT